MLVQQNFTNGLPRFRISPLFLSIYSAHVAHCDLYLAHEFGSITIVPQSGTSVELSTFGGTVKDLNRSSIPTLMGVTGGAVVVGISMGRPYASSGSITPNRACSAGESSCELTIFSVVPIFCEITSGSNESSDVFGGSITTGVT
jgi:hypothetical protein